MQQVIASLAPIVILLALGAGLVRWRFMDEHVRKGMERFVYWVSLPALLVTATAGVQFSEAAAGRLTVTLCLATLAMVILAWALAKVFRLEAAEVGVFTQAAFRSNLVFVGLPVLVFALDARGTAGAENLIGGAVLAIAPVVLLYNFASVIALLVPHHASATGMFPKLAKSIVTNPLILACVVGLIFALTPLHMPGPINKSLDMIGKTAGPLALIALGGALVSLPLRGKLGKATLATMLKVAGMPLLTWPIAILVGLPEAHLLTAMVLTASPTAVASYVLSTQLRGEPALAASCVTLSTLACIPALGVVLFVV